MAKSSRLRKLWRRCMLLLWKAVLIRKYKFVFTIFEFLVAILFSLQIRLIFQPLALNLKNRDQAERSEILKRIPQNVICRYAPLTSFTDQLMTKAANMLNIEMEPAKDEKSLMRDLNLSNNTPLLWAIFHLPETEPIPKVLEYKIRSTEIGKSQTVIWGDEEPSDTDPYVSSGFIPLQIAIEFSFVDMRKDGNRPILGDKLSIGRFPFHSTNFLVMPFMFRPNMSVIYYLTVMAFLVIPLGTMHKAIHDKETGFRELMRMMGMPLCFFYVGWIDYLLIVAVPATIFSALLLHPIYASSSFIVVFIFMLTYLLTATCFMFFIGTFFNNSSTAVVAGLLLWVILAVATMLLNQSMKTLSMGYKVLALLLPHSGLMYGLDHFTSRKEVEFEDTYRTVKGNDKVSIGLILVSWLLHMTLWTLLTIYFDNILPGKFGVVRSWYYPCEWLFPPRLQLDLSYRGSTNWSAVETTNSRLVTPLIRIRNLTKKFGFRRNRVLAIDDMSLDFYEGEFTVILGHNGAGKSSLLKTIVGMYEPTKGKVYIQGRDYKVNQDPDRNLIGFCPQENILVHYLTVIQHLYVFGMLKGMSYQEALEEAEFMLAHFKLQGIKYSKVANFSFGLQRRLCLAMALIGNAKILVLDEPTYAVDPENRKEIWDLLLTMKRDRTIIMVTNDMEGADIFADRIAIFANGRVECFGSKIYLNRRFGAGYVLSIGIQEDCDLDLLSSEIQTFSPGLTKLTNTLGLLVKYTLPGNTRFTKLLQDLESKKLSLKITSLSLSEASIEAQFMRIGFASQLKRRHVPFRHITYEEITRRRRRDLLTGVAEKKWRRLEGIALWRQQHSIMFYKKALHIFASWKLYAFSLFFSMIALAVSTTFSQYMDFHVFRNTGIDLNVTKYTANGYHMLYYGDDSRNVMPFLDILSAVGEEYNAFDKKIYFHISKGITATDLMINPNLISIEYRDHYFLAIDIRNSNRIDLMYSATMAHSGPIAINLLHNALLKYHTGCKECLIKLKTHPIVNPTKWERGMLQPRGVRSWQTVTIIVTLFLLLPSIDLIGQETLSNSKRIQINTVGVTTATYWLPIYLMDVIVYCSSLLIIASVITIGVSDITGEEIGLMLLILVSYGVAALPMGYTIHLLLRRTGTTFCWIMLFNFGCLIIINGAVTLPVLSYLISERVRLYSELILHMFPPYTLACAVGGFYTLHKYNRECKTYNTCGSEFARNDPCCQNCGNKDCYLPLSVLRKIQSGASFHHSIMHDIFILLAETLLFLLAMQIVERNYRRQFVDILRKLFSIARTTFYSAIETDVVAEKNRVNELMEDFNSGNPIPPEVVLVVQNLSKKCRKVPFVRDINFTVNRKECFGILGVNGVGKSTIFRMLLGVLYPDSGTAVIGECELAKDQDNFVGKIGYCPQNGGLNGFMTARQNLRMHAGLRGVPYECITDEIDKWLDVFDLLDFENEKLENCSWGVERKISVLQSLVGDLPVVFLDEPSEGMDAMAKEALQDTLHQVREMGRTFILITQSLEESEALCLRVGILVNGAFAAIGSCRELKQRLGFGFMLNIKIPVQEKPETVAQIKASVEEMFPSLTFKDERLGILKYELGGNLPYSNTFETLEALKMRHPVIRECSVNQTTMEQVFVSVTSKLREESVAPESVSAFHRWING